MIIYKPFDPKLIKEIIYNHPYNILLRILNNYYPSYSIGEENDANPNYDGYDYNIGEENDANPNYDGYDDNIVDLYFRMLDDYNRYGITFDREFNLFPDNKLGVFKNDEFGKTIYYLVKNWQDKKTSLFNNVKTIGLNKHDRGKKPLSEEEKQKRNFIKTQKIKNFKLQ